MTSCSLFLLESDLSDNIPGISPGYPSAWFPFWADYCFLDFVLSNYPMSQTDYRQSGDLMVEKHYVFSEKQKEVRAFVTDKFSDYSLHIHPIGNQIEGFVELLMQDDSEIVLFAPVTSILIFDFHDILDIFRSIHEDCIKIVIDHTSVELYTGTRLKYLSFFKDYKHSQKETYCMSMHFFKILELFYDRMVNIPGDILFINSINQLYHENIWLIDHSETDRHIRCTARFRTNSAQNGNSYIGKEGYIKNSYIASNVEIHGNVEKSVLFPNVSVYGNTRIKNSIIMNDNTIGEDCSIVNTIIFPRFNPADPKAVHIGNGVHIGGESSIGHNRDFPEQINHGRTVIGMNADIPAGFQIETGCYVGPDLTRAQLRKRKIIRKGTSVFEKRI